MQDQFDDFYKLHFAQHGLEQLYKNVAKELMEVFFANTPINNVNYERNVFKLTTKLIKKELSPYSHDEEFIKGFATYLFQKHMKSIYEHFAEEILREVGHANEKVMEFLHYYSLHTIIIDGEKYLVPHIKEHETAPLWHVTSMFPLLKVYVKTKEAIEKSEETLDELRTQAKSFYKDDLSPIEYNEKVQNKIDNINAKIEHNTQRISICKDSLSIFHDAKLDEQTNEEIEQLEQEWISLKEERNQLIKKKINQVRLFEYEQVLKKIEHINRENKIHHTILKQNENSHQSMKRALTQALISKKRPL